MIYARNIALAVLLTSSSGALAQQTSIKLVGIGAASCQEYLQEVGANPPTERDFIAWAQGYMSGLLIRAPAGVDEDLDLAPPKFPLRAQGEFLRTYCSQHASADFPEAVEALYRTLRPSSGN